jgi:hypothetical protein
MKKYRYKLLVIFLLFLFYACKKELVNDEKFIKNLSNDVDFNLPLYNESLIIFIKSSDSIYALSLRQLHTVNAKSYLEYKDFDSFLINSLNGDLLSKSDLIKNSEFAFKLDITVIRDYNSKGLDCLKNKYCEKSDINNKYYVLNDLSLNIKRSVMYFFFKNNFHIMQNDHSGKYVLIDKNF